MNVKERKLKNFLSHTQYVQIDLNIHWALIGQYFPGLCNNTEGRVQIIVKIPPVFPEDDNYMY